MPQIVEDGLIEVLAVVRNVLKGRLRPQRFSLMKEYTETAFSVLTTQMRMAVKIEA